MAKERIYDTILRQHLGSLRQMAFVSGPRQVGKTTTCRQVATAYLNWDVLDHQRLILKGPTALAEAIGLHQPVAARRVLVLDELHKYPKWKQFLKGFFDVYADQIRLVVTGSSRLDIFRKGGDSLMGRYFLYRMHPFTVAEIVHPDAVDTVVRPPQPIEEADWQALWTHGGFPEPFLYRDLTFTRRWRALRQQQLTKEDLREMTQVQELGALEVLIQILAESSGQQLNYSSLAREVNVSVDTVRRWLRLLEQLHYGYLLRPWFKRVTNALRKEPKWFLRDWSNVADDGARAESFVAAHLLKAVENWTDLGLGDFGLHYLRDKAGKEVDFVLTRDGQPWCLLEVKKGDTQLSPHLKHIHAKLGTAHAFQVVIDLPYQAIDCFAHTVPVVVPARTLLSQLV